MSFWIKGSGVRVKILQFIVWGSGFLGFGGNDSGFIIFVFPFAAYSAGCRA